METLSVRLAGDRVWEITTENGTRIVVNLRKGKSLWMRLPTVHADGTMNRSAADGHWRPLRGLCAVVDGEEQHTAPDDRPRQRKIITGFPVRIYTDLHEW